MRGIPANDVKTSTKLRREAPPACAWTYLRLVALAAVAALACGMSIFAGSTVDRETPQVGFLQQALGTRGDASLARRVAAGTVVELAPGGYRVRSGAAAVGLHAEHVGEAKLERFERGVSRRTEFGWEAVTVSPNRTEQFLTVARRQGPKTWRWQLSTLDLVPRVGADGAVAFIRDGRLLSELWIAPPRVLDANRNEITPAGVHWAVEQGREGWSLALDLDDSALPLPYVIDPAIVARTPASSANTGGGASTITITKPTGLVAGDLMLAQITTRNGSNVAICPPTATGTWTSVNRTNSTTTLGQEVFRLSATAADVAAASYAFQIRTGTCAGGLSSQKASGGIVAYVDTANQANPIDVSAGQAFASASTITPPAVTPTVANTRIASFYGAASGGTVGSNWTGVTGELWDQSSTGGATTSRTTSAAGDAAGSAVGVPFTPSTGDFASTNAVSIGQTLALAPLAPDGSGTLTTPTTNVAASSAGNTLTFTYTVATGGMRNGSVTLVVPAGWSAPSTTGTAAGYTTATSGTVSVASQTITVSGLTLTAGSTFTVTYGSTAGGGPGATATATTGAQTWQAQQRSSSASGALTNLAASPSVTVNAADGTGTLTTPTTNVAASSAGNTLTFTYTAAAGGMSNGAVRVTVPSGWSAPSTTGTAAGYTTASTGTVGVAGQVITVTGVTLAGSATMTITYGSTAGGGPGATATATTGAQTWQAAQRSVSASTITNLAASPSVTVNAADGTGTLTTPTTNVAASSAGNTLTFTYTAAAGGMSGGDVRVTVPSGWSAPSTTGTAAGYTTASTGTVGVAGQVITVTGVTLAGSATMTITYGSTAGGGPGATATATTGAQTWQAAQRSVTASTITNLAASPSVTVNAADGTGTLTTPTTNVAASSAGNTLTFTYTAAAGGMSNGAVRVTVPSGWSAPSTTGTAAGYTTASTGTVGVAGQVITVTGVTLAGSATMTITYGSTAGGGPGATATATTGAQTWQAAQRSVSASTITNLAASPSVTVNAADGTGTLTTPTTNVAASSAGNTLTFTYTAAAGGMSGGDVRVTVPSGWSAPSTTGTAAGYTTASTGTVGVAGQVITVTGVTLAGSATMTITYGSTAGGGPGATATATTGAQTWQGAQRSVAGSTITNLAASPSVTVNAADGTGTLTTPTTSVPNGSTGNTLTFTYTAAAGGMANGAVRVTVPTGWSAPSTTGTAAGYTTASTGTVGVAGQVITVTSVTLAGSATMTITYGSTAGGGPGATAPSTAGAQTWQAAQRSVAGSTITNLAASPSVTVLAADGTGTLGASPTSVVAGSTGQTVTLTYTAAAGGMASGAVRVTLPAGWSAPSTTGTAAGYTTASTGAVGVAGQVITVSGVTLAGAGTLTITYGSTAGGGPGATAPTSTGAGTTWGGEQRSSSSGAFTNLGASPTVSITPGPLDNFLVEAAGGGAIGTQTVGVPFSVRVTARDVNGNTVTAFNGAGNTVDMSSSGTLTAGSGTTAAFTNGVLATHSLTLGSTGSTTVTATRTSGGAQSGTSASFASNPGTLTNTSPVSITGTAKVGLTLTRSAAGWNPSPDSRAYQWRRCNAAGGACADIGGETGTSYTVAAADLGQTIRVVETASKAAYNDNTSTSIQTAVVALGDLTNTSPVAITGTAKVGLTLTRSAAAWTPSPDSSSYQWRRCNAAGGACADIGGETGTSYTLAAADLGQTIRVVETASKAAYNDNTSTSIQTAVVALGDLTNTSPVAVTGTAKVGLTLTRSAAAWTPSPDSSSYQWRRCNAAGGACADIGGETGTSYTLVAADLGQTIRVVETASKTAYNDNTSTSAQTGVVALGDLTNTSPVAITGTAKVGLTLTRSAAGWNPSPDARTYQWSRCDNTGANCNDIAGETGTTYTLLAVDLGATIRVVETASKAAYNDATSTSTQTAVVALGDLTNTSPVAITGTAKVGEVLTRSTAGWTPSPDSRSYQWRRCNAAGGACADIGGETGTSYTLVAADLGQTIRVVETASKAAYNDNTSTSTQTAVVALGDLTNTSPVAVTGTAKVGEVLSRSTAGWTPSPDSRSYQWRRCDNAGANCNDIAGETGTTYTLAAADLGQTIRVVETASKAAYNDNSSTSTQTAVVALGDLTNTSPVAITGTAKVGLTLTRSAAGWNPGPDSRAYQWRRCDNTGANCNDIAGETGTSYTLAAADLGQTIRVIETASKTAYNDATSTSAQTAVVALGDLTNTSPVAVTGTAKVGLTLTRSAAGWNPGPDARSYQWRRCDNTGANCNDIAGETGTSYTLAAADLGQTIRVIETASKTAYNDATSTSAQTAVVALGDLTNTSPVAITGTAKVGLTLTRSAAAWTPSPDSRAYQWRRCDNTGANCNDIAGETGTTYTLAAADLGQTIRVIETASKAAYNDATSTSAQTAVVAAGDLTNTSPVAVTGTAKVGEVLSRSTAGWTPSPDSRSYQWRRCDNTGANCNDIGGATSTDYTLVAADLGQTIRVVETASKTAYNDNTSTSAQTAVVALGDLTNTSPVAVTGTAKVGLTSDSVRGRLEPRPRRSQLPVAALRQHRRQLQRHRRRNRHQLHPRRRRPRPDHPRRRNSLQDRLQRQHLHLRPDRSRRARRPHQHLAGRHHRHRQGRTHADAGRGRLDAEPRLAQLPVAPLQRRRRRLRRHRRRDRHLATRSSPPTSARPSASSKRPPRPPTTTTTSTSAQTTVVAAGDLTNTSPASITGTAVVGNTLTRATAAWTPSPDARTYKWRRCDNTGANCNDIPGETGTTYTLAAADLGQTIRVVETASKTAYNDATSTSAQTAVVAAGTITNTGVPTVSGTPTVSLTLTATAGSWTPGGTTSAFQWVRCNADGSGCTDLIGQTAATYVVALTDLGKKLKVRETASKAGYTDASADSALTAVITDADSTPPTNTITLGSPVGAYLSGTSLYYRPSAAGSFTLSSAVADSGFGPASATYPAVGQFAWAHAGETVSTPAGGPYVSSAFSWTGVASGSFAYVVTASDAWSPPNTSQTTLTITQDSTAPSSSALCGGAACSAGWYTTSPVSVTLSSSDGGAGVNLIRYTTDGTDPTLFNGSTYLGAISVASDGTTTIKYRAYDHVGNIESVRTQLVRIDTVVPDTTVDSGPSGATNATNASLMFSSNDGAASFECRLLPGGSWGACSSPKSYSSLADDTYTFEARAVDQAGNTDASPATRTWTVDTVPADTTITGAPPTDTNATGASFSFVASDAGPSFECKLDAGAFGACTSPKTYAGLPEGAHTFSVRAVDVAGNVDPTPATHAWTVDTTAPDTTIPLAPADPSSNTTPTFGFGSSQSPATYECNLDGGGWSSCPTPHTVNPALADGSHTLQVRSTDAAGNTDATPASFTWVVDATAPTGSLTAPADGSAAAGTIVVSSNSADAGGTGVMHALFETSPAGAGTWTTIGAADTTAPYSVSLDTTSLADGDHDLRVTTRDNAGNSTVSAVRTIEVDNTAPSLTASAPNPVNLATADPATVTAAASDTGTGVVSVAFEQCNETSVACDSDTWTSLGVDTTAPYSAAWPIPGDGMRLLRVRATDGAGRQRTELVLTTVDRTAPTGTLTAPAAAANLRGTVPVAATASDPPPGGVASVEFQLTTQGSPYTDPSFASDASGPSYDGTLDTTAHADGLYDLRAFVNDANGNSSASPRVTVRVDNTPPSGSVTAPANGANLRGTVGLTSDSADGGSGVATVQFQRSPAGAGSWTNQAASWNTTLLTDGLYDLRVVTTDNAGNTFTSPAVTVRVDNTNPTGSVTAPANGANLRGTVGLTSDSADGGSGVATVQFQRSPAGAGSWTNQAASWNTTLLTDGLYDLRVVTTDNAGNTFTSPTITVRVDNTAPTGSVTAPANGAEIGVAPVTLTSDSADGGSGVDTVVFERRPAGGGPWTVTPPTWDTASGPHAVGDGSYDLRVTTTDLAGNSFTSGFVTVLVDHTAPVTTASSSPASPSNAPVTVTFSVTDGVGSGVAQTSYRVDGGSVLTGGSVVIAAPGSHANDGSHLVEFFSTDDVGNVEATKSVTVVIDTTATSGTTGDPGSYLRGIAQLAYTTSDTDVSSVQFQFTPAGLNLWVAIGGADVTPPYETSWDTTLVADGAYDLRAVVTDSAGNVESALLPGLPKYIDNTAPAAAVTSPPASAFISGSVDVNATGTDGAAPPASGVSAVRFEVKPAGSGSFSTFGTETTPVVGTTYRHALDTTAYAEGPTELRVVVTDVAGNETTSATRAVTIDNVAPTVSLDDPGAAISATPTLTASAAADTVSVTFEQRPAGSGSWTAIATDATAGDGFSAAFPTTPLADGLYELRARALDGGGNPGTSGIRSTLVDNVLPTGSLTTPSPSDVVGGSSVGLTATAADSGSGVASVEFTVKPQGSPTYSTISTDSAAPYAATWDATGVPDGPADLRLVITDVAGNQRQSAVVPVTVDSTGPSVTLNDPGAVVAGDVSLTTTTGGGATRVVFGISPAGGGSWSQLAEDTSAPFGATVDTSSVTDGLYDLRAIGYDAFGNASAPSVRAGVRFDNTAPRLVSSTPQDGSVSASANAIVLSANEPAVVTGGTLDGAPAPAPSISGTTLTFATGSLSDGLHVLSGRLEDASGTSAPFRVAVTIESAPAADRPPVEKSATPDQTTVVTSAGSLGTVSVPAAAWPPPPTAEDFLVVRIDPSPALAAFSPSLAPGSQLIEVTAHWALAGTAVTQFAAPITITIANTSGTPVVPALSQDGTSWRSLPLLGGDALPGGQPDGFYRDAGGVHVVTRHLTYFALLRDVEPPTPPIHMAGVVADDGLTLRWIPGSDNSGELGAVHLYVNGESYGMFDPTQFETKLGSFTPEDTRAFTFVQFDAAGNRSVPTTPLRGIPPIVGAGLERATALLAARGLGVGEVRRVPTPGRVPGTVLRFLGNALAVEGAKIDLVVAGGTAPQTALAFQIASAKRLVLARRAVVAARVKVTRPAILTATLRSRGGRPLQTWRRSVKAGASIVKLPLSARVRTPGVYRLVWVAKSGSTTVRRSVRVELVRPGRSRTTTKARPFEFVVTGNRAPSALRPALRSRGSRVHMRVGPDAAFTLAAAANRDLPVILVDVDELGIGFLRDLRTVFPAMRLVALASDPATLARAGRAGASLTVPRSARLERLARALRLGR